jgi:hypothetical protein
MNQPGGTRVGRRLVVVISAGALLLGGLVIVVWRIWQFNTRHSALNSQYSAHIDPRLTYPTAYRNVRPEVRYVGDSACAECHADVAETYRRHPMGRSLSPVSEAASVEHYDQAASNPFEKEGFQFLIERRDGRVFHREFHRDSQGRSVPVHAVEIHFAIGSGRRGRSYLIDREGYVFQSLLSWYSQPGVWDFTPGFQVREQFERPAEPSCLFCHSNQVKPVAGTVNRYELPVFRGHAIGCERCHGPGELHVHSQKRGEEMENTIVNPGRLAPALRDAVCQQCHLQGESRIVRRGRQLFDYRPGLPLHLFLSVFVRPNDLADGEASGSHTEQIYDSRCFRESQGKLGCISCHDPHALPEPARKVDYYRRRCLACHAEQGCSQSLSLRQATAPADDCVSCHMPRTGSKIVHRAVTDHRIRRQPDPNHPAQDRPRKLFPGEIPLVHFHRDLAGPEDGEVSRDLALALMELAKTYPPLAAHVKPIALPRLEAAVQAAPEDVPAWEAKGFALWQQDRKSEALAAFTAALAKAPERELTLTYLAVLAAALTQREEAIAYWQRAIVVNPWCSQYHFRLANLLAERQDWQKALQESEAAIALNPAAEEMRVLLITCLLRTGKQERARRELDTLVASRPGEREKLLRWFEGQLRSP